MKKTLCVGIALLLAGVISHAQQCRNVIIAVIDGARYSETFGDTLHQDIPKIWNQLRPLGTIFTRLYVDGLTTTNPGHASILTGTWQTINNDGTQRPSSPTVFEYFRKHTGALLTDNYVVLGKDKLDILNYGNYGAYGPPYGASVKASTSQYDDGLTLQNFTDVATASHPRLVIINFAGTDNAGHSGAWSSYLSAIRRVDSLTHALYTFLRSDPIYRDSTALIIVNDHGRHSNGISSGFSSHGDGCDGCRHIMLMIIGPGIPAAAVDTTRRAQIDIAPTVGRLLGFQTPFVAGVPIASVLVTDVAADGPPITSSFTLHLNYPNPFNPSTTIRYGLPERSLVSLAVYNTLGQQVAQLVSGEIDAGYHDVTFKASNLPSGVYFYRLQAGKYVETRKLCLVR